MATVKKVGSVKRFGARYGRTVKEKVGKIEEEQRKKHKCPYCLGVKVRRTSTGIWHCERCNATFASRAYTVAKRQKLTEAPVDDKKKDVEQEEPEDEEDVEDEEDDQSDTKEPTDEGSGSDDEAPGDDADDAGEDEDPDEH
jgi:ribosomal protein eL43